MSKALISKKSIIRQRPELKYIRAGGADKEPHEHDHPELIFVSGGSGRFEVNDNQYPIKAGDLIICCKNVTHSEYLFDVPGSNIYHLGFIKTVLVGMEEDEILHEPFCIIHTENNFSTINTYFQVLMNEERNKQICGKAIEDDIMRVLLISAIRLAVYDIGMAYFPNKAFYEAKSYFDRNFIEIKSIEQVCEKIKINKFYLTHIFKEQLDMPPIRYLQFKRVEKAKQLLTMTDLPVGEVALRCGYPDTAYFCRVFKKLENTTPLQFKAQAKRSYDTNDR